MSDADLPGILALWRSDEDWDYGPDTVRFLTDQDVCPNKCFLAIYRGEIIGLFVYYAVIDMHKWTEGGGSNFSLDMLV